MKRINRPGLAVLLLVVANPLVLASDVSYWTHSTADDYAEAMLENLVVTNYGDVQLTRRLEPLAEGMPGVSVVYALVEAPDGTVYAGTGPGGIILRIRDGQAQRFELPGAGNIFALVLDGQGRLLAGTGGEAGKVLRVSFDGDEAATEEMFAAEGVRYVWRIARHADGKLYVATGPTAALYELGDGEPRQVFTAPGEKNLLSLALGEGDTLYVGTDPNGLVWQVNRRTGESRVLFDAAEPEVTALLVSGRVLYVVGAARGEAGMEEEPGAGMPEVMGSATPITRQPVVLPVDPDLPPPEPDRLPLDEIREMQDPPDLPGQDQPEEAPDQDQPDELQIEPRGFGPPVAEFGGEGSAVYRIDLDNGELPRVSGVLRDAALFLDAIEQNGRLLLAAGAGEGEAARVLQLDPATNELALLAEPDARQIATMLPLQDGRILLGLANPGGVAALGAAYAEEGMLTSAALDAGAISQYGTIQLSGRLPAGTQMLLSTRSGNTDDPAEDAAGWGAWSEPVGARRFVPAAAPAGRFFQYRLIFRSDGSATPSLEKVRVAYLQPNLPPQVLSLEISSEMTGLEVADVVANAMESGAPPSTLRAIQWEATDPNGDPLRYDLYYRRDQRGEFQLLADNLAEPGYAWDAKSGGDGLYEFRVVARDDRGNPPGAGLTGSRVSEPIEVDLTPPRIGDIEVERGAEATTLRLRVVDGQGIVARLEYLLSGDPAEPTSWARAFPEDGMTDSPEERFTLELKDVPPTGGVLRLRAVDDSGNIVFASVSLPGS